MGWMTHLSKVKEWQWILHLSKYYIGYAVNCKTDIFFLQLVIFYDLHISKEMSFDILQAHIINFDSPKF